MKRRTLLQLSAGAASLCAPAIARDTLSQTLLFVPFSNLTTLDPGWTTAAVVQHLRSGFLRKLDRRTLTLAGHRPGEIVPVATFPPGLDVEF